MESGARVFLLCHRSTSRSSGKENVKLKRIQISQNRRVSGGIKDSILSGSKGMSWTHNLK